MSGAAAVGDPQGSARPSRLSRWVPAATWIRHYDRSRLPHDLLAGAVVAALAVPQALGYAGIAGVPVQMGLYALPLALLAYALLGSSPHLVVGPVSTVAVLSGSLVADMAHGDPARAASLTSALAISAGIGMLIGGFARLGWAVEFLSRPLVTGFVFGLVLLIVLGEIPSLLGMPAENGDVVRRALAILTHLTDLTPLTAAIGIGTLAVLFLGAKLLPRVPWSLLVLVVATATSAYLDLAAHGVATVGTVPRGIPPFGLPHIGLGDLEPVAVGGVALALVGLAEGLSAGRLFAARFGYELDADQEFVATGGANVAAGLSGGLGVAGSLSKTAASIRAGSTSQITGVMAALLVVVVLVVLAPALSALPRTVLSAIVIQAVWGLLDLDSIRRYAHIRRNDFVAAVAAAIGVLLLGPLYGLLFALGLAVLGLVYRSSRVHVDVMGKVPGEKAAWGSLTRHPERKPVSGIRVLRLDVPLFWANAHQAVQEVLHEVDAAPGTKVVILDLEATSQLDTTAVDALTGLLVRLRGRGIDLYLVRVFYQSRGVLLRAGFTARLGSDHMWHSISAAVRAAKDAVEAGGGVIELPDEQMATDESGDERIATGVRDRDDDRHKQRRREREAQHAREVELEAAADRLRDDDPDAVLEVEEAEPAARPDEKPLTDKERRRRKRHRSD
jgi:SulP family sulfate permease